MEYCIDPQLFYISAPTESEEMLGRSTADKGTQTGLEFYSEYRQLDNFYHPLSDWSFTTQMADSSPYPDFASPYSDFASPYTEPVAMFVDSQIHGYFPPHFLPMAGIPEVPSFASPVNPMSFEPPLTEPPAERPVEDCIVVSLETKEIKHPAKTSRPENRRRSARLSNKRSSELPQRSAPQRQQKRETIPLQPGEHLSKPLSKLAREMPQIRKLDIDAYIRRGADKRVQYGGFGVENKISRPSNSFLLYRKAYGPYARALSKKNRNLQLLSQMIGASYRSEDQGVKDQFARYAAIEKEQHSRHFPDYKYCPKKPSSEY
ncbi:hypothetical protein F5B18DRAFT_655864 [Nemania serpens]|nr:hypothetical protein F5B18DRAFT_655864 [Nemania serpens]